jgi:hypothetical protein
MPLNLYPNVYASGAVHRSWTPSRSAAIKYPVRNRAVVRELRRLRAGVWKKVIKQGDIGEVHYFERKSGSVAGVKFVPKTVRP